MASKLLGFVLLGGGLVAVTAGAVVLARGRHTSLLGRETVKSGGMTLVAHRKKKLPIKERVGILQDLTHKSVKDPQMRKLALHITRNCASRDEECEARAIYDWIKKNIRYTGDIGAHKLGRNGPVEGVDLFQTAARTVEFGGGDCLPAGTLMLVEGHRLVPIEDVVVGSKIWGYDRWSSVENVWYKGSRSIDAVQLNNGSWVKATPDHKVYVAICDRHPLTRKGGPCSCPMEARRIERIPVSELTEKMVLVTPDRIPFGSQELDPDRALVEGLYLADGWRSHDSDFDIAGCDGHPKEAQKKLVEQICERLGVETTWFRKSIRVRDAEWARRVQLMGEHAPDKHALSIDLDEGAAGSLLRGIMADSGANTNGNGRTFTSTSYPLSLQARLLHKMFGVTCSERFIEEHGGLGQHPIWRLGVRDQNRSDGRREKLLRVRDIQRNVATVPVWDISTDDHYVYLPQADVTVSNCDDHGILGCTLGLHNGFTCNYRVTSPTRGRGDDYAHIYGMLGFPKNAPRSFKAIDTTLPKGRLGVEAPFGKRLDFTA